MHKPTGTSVRTYRAADLNPNPNSNATLNPSPNPKLNANPNVGEYCGRRETLNRSPNLH